ncbi:maleylacetoacetate isomerase MaiA [Aspergillus affinis]|uniref:maleylacetoacetate isomerase MaiA n=1 Tax=Aspergillus affinis TaxID=1070780 RepID=UPI0022FDEF33|nr:maleylacetoacetate isomerase [Aspergillus affinis]KAI9046291.1 maleylacetoacetate isomerase [Aspergillus affinis]
MPQITLYTYFRSSCSARLRIALALKNLPYTAIPINLLKDEQHSTTNTTLNPSATVPTLLIKSENNTVKITQSLAALEYLDETFPDTASSLLPPTSDPSARALVRTLSHIIACDVQPVTNLRILKRVAPLGVDRGAWSKELIEDGFRAYEAIAEKSAGRFSVGDEVTMADVCLIPAVWGAQRVGVELERYPTIDRVARGLEEVEAVKLGHWRNQEDTPEEFRV